MTTITDKTIERLWRRLNEAVPEDGQKVMEKMTAEQPFLIAYLLAIEETILAEHERGELLILGVFIWQSLSSVKSPLRQVAQEEIESVEARNLKFLEDLEAGSEIDYVNAMQQLTATYNQMPLLGAVIESVMSGHEEEPELAPDNLGLALLHLKTIIDCLDQ